MLKEALKKVFIPVREKSPLIHCITNYVTVNDCANIILACGASPVMSDEILDAVDITKISSALLLNIGTLTQRTVDTMRKCAKIANDSGIPIVLDPVGAGATKYRTDVALELIQKYKIAVLRGNISEIKTLAGAKASTKGVDASCDDIIDYSNVDSVAKMACDFSKKIDSIVSISGKVDIIADKDRVWFVKNGNAKMSLITGTGCQSSALTASFVAANPANPAIASVCSAALMGVAGERALLKNPNCGNSSYRNFIIDEVCNITVDEFLGAVAAEEKKL